MVFLADPLPSGQVIKPLSARRIPPGDDQNRAPDPGRSSRKREGFDHAGRVQPFQALRFPRYLT